MKIALVHDFLKEYGGAERVLETLHEIWPEAPVYTSFVDWKGLGPHAQRIKKWKIKESWVGKNWFVKKFHSPLRFLAPKVWESFDFSGYNAVITSSGWYISRGIIVQKPTVHICYLHHPPRHLYGYQTAVEWQKYFPVRVYAHIVNHFLRMYDFEASQRVDYFIANSIETQRRITKFYRRDSVVIYPPVEIKNQNQMLKRTVLFFQKGQSLIDSKNYFLSVCRLARAKHVDLIIDVCQKLDLPLVIVGKGREEEYLKSKVKGQRSKVKFLGEVPDEDLPILYKNAKALIFASKDEEFGIVPVEAMGQGTPVVAYKSGGLKETVVEGKTGVFFEELTVESLMKAIKRFDHLTILSSDCIAQARKFSKERFKKEIKEFVERAVKTG